MSLVNIPSTTAIPTPAEYQAITQGVIKSQLSQLYNQMITTFTNVNSLVYQNQNLTTQEVFNALGTDGGTLVSIMGSLASDIQTGVPSFAIPANPVLIVINADGTVTVT